MPSKSIKPELLYSLPQTVLGNIYSFDETYKIQMKRVFEELDLKNDFSNFITRRYFSVKKLDVSHPTIKTAKVYYGTHNKYYYIEFMNNETYQNIKGKKALQYNAVYERDFDNQYLCFGERVLNRAFMLVTNKKFISLVKN